MIVGVAWAVLGYILAKVTQRGELATTIITAMAGALGLGAGVLRSGGAPGLGAIALGIEIAASLVALAGLVLSVTMGSNQQHKAMFLASVRQAYDPESPEDSRLRARRERRYW